MSRQAFVAGDIFREEDIAQLVRVVPQREGHSLELHWAIPPQQPQWRSRPAEYLSHLIGYAALHHVIISKLGHVYRSHEGGVGGIVHGSIR